MKAHNSFCFIHAADLHLDSPFKGITAYSKAIGDALRAATFDAFDDLIDLCIRKQVQFLLVAGDIYDGADRSLRAQLKFRDGLARLSEHNIHAFVVHGNHDPVNSQSSAIEWPDKVHIFNGNKAESKTVKRQDGLPMAVISGISHARSNETQNLTRKFSREDPGVFHIGLLHCNVGSNTGHEPYAPCELSDLMYPGIDYWALGHVHERVVLCTDPYVAYAGNTQGRNIREQGERGCWLVTVNDRHVSDIQFCPVDSIRWFSITVNIDGLNTIDRLERAIWKNIQELMENHSGGSDVILRVSIAGRGPLYSELQRENAILDLLDRTRDVFASEDPFVWVQEIESNCRPEIDLDKLKQRGEFLSQVVKIAEEMNYPAASSGVSKARQKHETISKQASGYETRGAINGPQVNAREILKPVLSDLLENRHIQKALEEFSQDETGRIIERAALLCVNMLEGNE